MVTKKKKIPHGKRCGAKTRAGKRCRRWAMANGRCMMHGGKSPKGEEHPRFKTGLHSKYMREKLKGLIGNKKAAEEISKLDFKGLDDEVQMAAALLSRFIKENSKDVDSEWFERAMKLIDNLAKQKERRVKMQKELRTITLEELENIIRRYTLLVYGAVERHVKGKKVKETLLAHLQNIPDQVAISVGA
jgi:hypothetical protein